MRQLPLAISPPIEADFDNFVAGANAEALARVRALAARPARARRSSTCGVRPGSGRTHLLRAAARANAALVVADDVESLDAGGAAGALHRHQRSPRRRPGRARRGQGRRRGLPLREDLRTRLAWGLVYQLQADRQTPKRRSHLQSARRRRRGCSFPTTCLRYLLTRLPRDLASLSAVLEGLDRHSLMR